MRIVGFGGLTPKTHDSFLDRSDAVVARNVDLYRKSLVPFNAPKHISTVLDVHGEPLSNPATLLKLRNIFVGFTNKTTTATDFTNRAGDFSKLFVDSGKLYRFSETTVHAKSAPTIVGIAPPCDPPAAITLPGVGCKQTLPIPACEPYQPQDPPCNTYADAPEVRSYVSTYVTNCGEESAPSTPSNIVNIQNGDAVSLLDPATPPSNAKYTRWYRSIITSKGEVTWALVGQTELPVRGFIDDKCSDDYAEELKTKDEFPPPECITGVADFGLSSTLLYGGTNIYVSKPRLPHAYQECSHYTIPDNIITSESVFNSSERGDGSWVCLFTDGGQYIISGTDFTNVKILKLDNEFRLSSPTAICSAEGVIYMGSREGISVVTPTDQKLLTDSWCTEIEWRKYDPEHQHLAYHAGKLHVSFPRQDKDAGLIFTATTKDSRRFTSFVTTSVNRGAMTVVGSRLYYSRNTSVYEWAGSTDKMRYTWRSARGVHNGVTHFTSMKVVADFPSYSAKDTSAMEALKKWQFQTGGVLTTQQFIDAHPEYASSLTVLLSNKPTVDVTIYADGVKFFKRIVTTQKPFKIPRKYKVIEWSIEVSSALEIYEVHLQTSSNDLAQEGGMA